MKKLLLLLLACTATMTRVQAQAIDKQIDTSIYHTHRIIPEEKAELLKNVDLIANMQYGFLNDFVDGKYTDSKFSMNQFRLEIKGNITDRVFFRFRDRYTRQTTPGSLDNLSRSTDMAFVGVKASDKIALSFGKMCADWGGYEFDLNPIDIYAYNDIVEYADNFLMGAQFSWKISPRNTLTIQALNSRTQSFTELYDTVPGLTTAKFPFAFVGNWRGKFFDGKFQTLWSYSIFKEAQEAYMNYFALGNQFESNKILLQYDFKWSNEQLDRKTIVTSMIPHDIDPYPAQNVRYVEHWLRCVYTFHPRWNVSAIGMVSDAYWNGNPNPNAPAHLRTAWGVIPSVEFFPFKNLNLKFFATYVGRFYNYSSYAKNTLGNSNYTTGQLSLGFITPLVVL